VDGQWNAAEEEGMTLTAVRNGQYVQYRAGDAEITAYLSEPRTPGPHAAMLVIQPVHGLIPLMEVVADRLAERGYVALAPALYSRLGTITTDPDGPPTEAARVLQRQTPDPQVVGDLRAGMDYLRGLASVGDEKIGAVGFCAGGRWGLFLSAADPRLDALVAFYPTVIDEETKPHWPMLVWDAIPDVGASVCVLFGDQDYPTVEKYRDRLRNLLAEQELEYEFHLYAGAGHGFVHEDAHSYCEDAARGGWAVAHDFLGRKLARSGGR
jgi:carboxymethylenebutenolidase